MAGLEKHYVAKLLILDLLIKQADRFMASMYPAPALALHQVAELDELQRVLDLAKLSPHRQVNWYDQQKGKGQFWKRPRTPKAELVKAKVLKAQSLLAEVDLTLSIRAPFYIVLEQHRDIFHTQSATHLMTFAREQVRHRKIPLVPRPVK